MAVAVVDRDLLRPAQNADRSAKSILSKVLALSLRAITRFPQKNLEISKNSGKSPARFTILQIEPKPNDRTILDRCLMDQRKKTPTIGGCQDRTFDLSPSKRSKIQNKESVTHLKTALFVGGPHDGLRLAIPVAPLPTVRMPGEQSLQSFCEILQTNARRLVNTQWNHVYELSLAQGEPHYLYVGIDDPTP